MARVLGPGWITGASDDDPSGIGTYSNAGSLFGYGHLWTMLFTVPLMSAVQEMCARIGQVTGKGLAGVMRQHYSRPVLFFIVAFLLFANTINIAADIGAMAASMQLLIDLPFAIGAIFFTVVTLVLEIFVSYKTYAKYLKFLTITLFSYIISVFFIKTDWIAVIGNLFLPHIEFSRDFLFVLVGIFGTTISPYLFFWQASSEVEGEIAKGRTTLAQRKGATAREINTMRLDVIIGMIFSNLVALCIMITAAGTLFSQGIVIETAYDAAQALRPLAGDFSSLLFSVGIIGTGLLAIPILAGSASYALSEACGWKSGLYRKWRQAHGFYGIITLATFAGLIINFIGIDPIKLLLWTAVLNGVAAPILLIFIVRIGNNKKIMKEWKNGPLANFFGWATVGVMILPITLLLYYWR